MKLAREDLTFLRSLGRALLALTASALFLLVFFVAGSEKHKSTSVTAAGSQTIQARQFQTILGATELHGQTLVLKSLQSEGNVQHAMIGHHIVFPAKNYALLRYSFKGFQPGLKVQLLWRTAETLDTMFAASVPGGSGGTTYANIALQPDWRGTITDIGLYITGDLRDQNLTLSGLSFEPYSWRGLISSVFFEWTEFRGWTGASINLLSGTPNAPRSETLSPTLAMASWAGLALIFLGGYSVIRGRKSLISYCAVVLIPWVALDQLWQSELSAQLQETRRIFGSKSIHEKHLVDNDSYIYGYTKRLQEEVLPASGARIIILDASENNYVRLKTQYYLLSHNIYNGATLPPMPGTHPGDYLLVLGDIPGLRYLSAEEVLAWEPNHRIKASLVDADSMGQLFQVMPDDRGDAPAPELTRQD